MFIDCGILYNCVLFFLSFKEQSFYLGMSNPASVGQGKNTNSQKQHLQKHISFSIFLGCSNINLNTSISLLILETSRHFFSPKDSEFSKRERQTLPSSLSRVQQSGMKTQSQRRTCDTIPLNSNCQRKGGIVPFSVTKNAILRILQTRNSTSVLVFFS